VQNTQTDRGKGARPVVQLGGKLRNGHLEEVEGGIFNLLVVCVIVCRKSCAVDNASTSVRHGGTNKEAMRQRGTLAVPDKESLLSGSFPLLTASGRRKL
jgi:hypothetical protein